MNYVAKVEFPLLCAAGRPWPMGVVPAVVDGKAGLNAAVFSRNATAIELCLYSEDGMQETARVKLPACTGGVWHGFLPGLKAGQLYGLRAHGPWDPAAGHRFNPRRLLIDPWTRSLSGSLAALGLESEDDNDAYASPSVHDNAHRIPKSRVIDIAAELGAGAAITPGPDTPMARTVLYEANVKGLTALHPEVPVDQRGTFAGVASAAMLAHYKRLGVTALCLLPTQLHMDERHLIERGLTNYWGYNTLAFFVPDPRFSTSSNRYANNDDAIRAEFRQMVDTLHRNRLEVILDVVYNHTAEGDVAGPILSWRGLDNASWYTLGEQGQNFNPSGCGNTFNMGEPRVIQLIMDSLRWWVQAYGVDGFRFDLAVALGRDPKLDQRYNPAAAVFAAIAQDPVLSSVKLIAEPWDMGPEGYQAGNFASLWSEWNDKFRDTVRAWWLGYDCTRGQIARRLAGSSDLFQGSGRSPLASINMVTAHDGFTLADLTAFQEKHNEANGEANRDGHNHNLSANSGCEGATHDDVILQRRSKRRRALLATALCAQGTPQLLAGDELGHSQQGNNNAYCQDNVMTWLDWPTADAGLASFVGALVQLRQRYPGLRYPHWFSGECMHGRLLPDIEWHTADGTPPDLTAWELPDGRLLACVITVGEDGSDPLERLMLILLAGEVPVDVQLPEGAWDLLLDSAEGWVSGPSGHNSKKLASSLLVTPPNVLVLVQRLPIHSENPA